MKGNGGQVVGRSGGPANLHLELEQPFRTPNPEITAAMFERYNQPPNP